VGSSAHSVLVSSRASLDLPRPPPAPAPPADAFCTACLSGRYPVPVPVATGDSKRVLEPAGWGVDEEPSLPVGPPPSA
jgi:hypothetical protein